MVLKKHKYMGMAPLKPCVSKNLLDLGQTKDQHLVPDKGSYKGTEMSAS